MNSFNGREALLRAAVKVVGEQGLNRLTYRRVAEEAGVSHALIRHHFGTKDQLIEAALQFAINESLSQTGMFSSSTEAHSFARGIESLSAETAYLQTFQYEVLLESRRRPELKPLVAKYYEVYRSALRKRLFELGVDDEVLAETIWFALDGIVMKRLTLGEDQSTQDVLHFLRQLVSELTASTPES